MCKDNSSINVLCCSVTGNFHNPTGANVTPEYSLKGLLYSPIRDDLSISIQSQDWNIWATPADDSDLRFIHAQKCFFFNDREFLTCNKVVIREDKCEWAAIPLDYFMPLPQCGGLSKQLCVFMFCSETCNLMKWCIHKL